MRNIYINEFDESIFEPFWDCGESYPEHQKYSVLDEYDVKYPIGAKAIVHNTWCGVSVDITHLGNEPLVMERNCNLKIDGFDGLRLFASIPENVRVEVYATIDGDNKRVISTFGKKANDEYDGHIEGDIITDIKLLFYKSGKESSSVNLKWMGLFNSKRQQEVDNRECPYDSDWKGCFETEYEIKPTVGVLFNSSELEALRKKVQTPVFSGYMDKIRKTAASFQNIDPEKMIGTYIKSFDKRWVSNKDYVNFSIAEMMRTLAFVGIVDENKEMLHRACRCALSVAHTKHWCESIMGVFPGATWHHRSFLEEELCRSCALVLDWAGNLLTWHGKNILYDAIIFKGLPRIEADFKTVEYIREMNQGIVFSSGRIISLIVLAQKYPRYAKWLRDAEEDFNEMVDAYIMQDGGTLEGPDYWNYTFMHVLPIIIILARYNNKTVEEYMSPKLKKTFEYALTMLSDTGNGDTILPINDSNSKPFNPVIIAGACALNDDRWKKIYELMFLNNDTEYNQDFLIIAPEVEKIDRTEVLTDGILSCMESGQTSVRRTDDEIGRIHLHTVSGPVYFAHTHGDKGSFVLEVNSMPIFIDRGKNNFSQLPKSFLHNMFVPYKDGVPINQLRETSKGGRDIYAKLSGNKFEYLTDTTRAWDDTVVNKSMRKIYSPNSRLYVICDYAELSDDYEMCFSLNTYGEIQEDNEKWSIINDDIQVNVYNKDSFYSDYGKYGTDGKNRDVNLLRIYSEKRKKHYFTTVIEILTVGEESQVEISDNTISYKGNEIDTDNLWSGVI